MNKTLLLAGVILGIALILVSNLSNMAYAVGSGLPPGDRQGGGCGGNGLSGGCGGGGAGTGAGGCGGSFAGPNAPGVHCGGRG